MMKRQRSLPIEETLENEPITFLVLPDDLLFPIINPIFARSICKFFSERFKQNLIEAVGKKVFFINRLPKNGVLVGCLLPLHIKLVNMYYCENTHAHRNFTKVYPNAKLFVYPTIRSVRLDFITQEMYDWMCDKSDY